MPRSIIDFYDPLIHGKDSKHRTLNSILSRSDSWLEYSHDYIQILFPLPEPSPFNYFAPVVDRATFEAFQARPELRTRLKESFLRILKFFGFVLVEDSGDVQVEPAPDFASASQSWFRPMDHNHLRITRVIRSLRVLGLEEEALAFFAALKMLAERSKGRVSKTSLMYWERAALRPLFARPEDRKINKASGLDFLVEFDGEKNKKASPMKDPGGEEGGTETPNTTIETTKDCQQEPATLPTKIDVPKTTATGDTPTAPLPATNEPIAPYG
ncbi:MAG: hypothetical protein M1839_002062 [Geoglossum umbratile]|nr:MAG: hypothetical protein M1839_002062 [Geoglossum umbratile]